ncbi:MAG: hypothetical protein B6I19_03965 [Bacteroidetes bacterium 4572_114]|nr:MAG: hypothetical protein B6I19_03965 [Bacteroidetes bacterium 4572_114]
MKKLTLSIALAIVVSFASTAQTPQAFKYQAVVRDMTGTILASQTISLRMSILDGPMDGTVIYSETHTATTNQFGLVNIEIGNGTPDIGTFSDIQWGWESRFLETEIDPTGDTNYVSLGISEFLSVPYAKEADGAMEADFAMFADQSMMADHAMTADHAMMADNATMADNAMMADHAMMADNAMEADHAMMADNAMFADNAMMADNAMYADEAFHAVYADFLTSEGKVGIGTTSPKSKLQVEGGIQLADDSDTASADKAGTIRYREEANNSYIEMCMKTGAGTYAWIVIKQNSW